jgi:ADP-ribose pyrophosphatase YjhB (NUDIX family)
VAAAREAAEERGLQVQSSRLLGVASRAGIPSCSSSTRGTRRPDTAAGAEALDVGFFDPDSLPPLAFEHDLAIIQRRCEQRAG